MQEKLFQDSRNSTQFAIHAAIQVR